MFLSALLMALVAGVAMALQSPTNTSLSRCVGNFQATLVSFSGAVIILSVAVALAGQGNLANVTGVPWWQLLGGVYGISIIIVMTFATPVLGVALTLTAIMLGQLVMGTAIDAFGLLLMPAQAVGPLRLFGCALTAAGILLVYWGKKRAGQTAARFSARAPFMLALAFAAGTLSAVQAPTNAALGAAVGTLEASLVSFAVGFAVILVITLVATKGRLRSLRGAGVHPWMFFGGIYGAINVFCVTTATPVLGAGLIMAGVMCGQLLCGMVVDARGLLLTQKVPTNAQRFAGIALVAAGIAVVTIARTLG